MQAENDRRQRLLQLAAAAVFLAIVAVAVLIVVSSAGNGGDTKLEGKAEVDRLLRGIPQEMVLGDQGLVLGDLRAPVELIEFGDLQCPVCKGYSEDILPPIIETKVRQGQVKLIFLNFTIIGEQSAPAGAAALAAGMQGRGWNYVELFYRNQGEENSGYANAEFLEAVAEGAGVRNIARWNKERTGLTSEVVSSTADAGSLGFEGTPSFVVKGPNSNGAELLGTPGSTEALEEAIERAS